MKLELALFEPDIALNVGALMRLCACLEICLHIIEPCGFPWNKRKIQQSGMDYIDHVDYMRHNSWDDFINYAAHKQSRLILMTTKGACSYTDFSFQPGDILIAGSESAGAPVYVHARSDARLFIPMYGEMRSLNIACASAMIVGEALRQIQSLS